MTLTVPLAVPISASSLEKQLVSIEEQQFLHVVDVEVVRENNCISLLINAKAKMIEFDGLSNNSIKKLPFRLAVVEVKRESIEKHPNSTQMSLVSIIKYRFEKPTRYFIVSRHQLMLVSKKINGSRKPKIKNLNKESSGPLSGNVGFKLEGKIIRVWYATNRLADENENYPIKYTSKRSKNISYGTCEVLVPKSHKFGSLGSSRFTRWRTGIDDRVQLRAIEKLPSTEFWETMHKYISGPDESARQALIHIHGFNVSFEEAAIRAGQIGVDLKVRGLMAFFSWPSRGETSKYPQDVAAIQGSEAALTEFLADFAEKSGVRRIHIIAHSMGNQGLLRALQRIHANAELRAKIPFGQILLAAPDIDADLFTEVANIYKDLSQRTTLYASESDRAVGLSQWLHDAKRAGFTPLVTIVDGVDTVEVPNFNLDFLGHGYYAEAAMVLTDLFLLLRYNEAPNDRLLDDRVTEEGHPYWCVQDTL